MLKKLTLRSITHSAIAATCLLSSNLSFATNQATNNSQWVDPFIGTGGDGHTFPGAVVPFGMVQLSPDTAALKRGHDPQAQIYKHCAGYHYDDTTIVGFSHTHFSGTGHSDLGDLLIMPVTGKPKLQPGSEANPDSGYRSRFSHDDEQASPGYYQVKLQDYDINAELTATERAAMHKYTFNSQKDAHVVMDLTHSIYNFDNKVIWSDVRVIDEQTILAYRATNGWAKNRQMYFAIKFSQPFSNIELINQDNNRYRCMGCLDKKRNSKKPSTIVNSAIKTTAGKAIKMVASFDNAHKTPLLVKVGISAVSRSNALENLNTEIDHWDFDKVRTAAKAKWNEQLNVIEAKGSKSEKRQLYTALYHALQAPSIYQDVNGEYRGVDGEIHKDTEFTNYTLFSLWDTYRALHPLLTYLAPDKTADMINAMMRHYEQSYDNMLPIWSFHGHETWTMIGYHAVSVIADAYMKDIKGFDAEKALAAMIATANARHYDAIPEYKQYGYVPMDVIPESVSITLEYAYNDFAIAVMAEKMGKADIAKTFYKRAMGYKHLFDKSVNFMRGKDTKGNWNPDFNPQEAKYMGPFTEGNSFQYSFYVPHDVAGLVSLYPSEQAFENRLDELFKTPLSEEMIKEHEDIAGLIGQYAHGNEPSHHIAYLYNYIGKPWRTQERIRQIMDTLSSDKPDGLAGNDDVGQMSAWYIFSAMGFYPVAPGDLNYAIGAPQLPFIALKLQNGKTFSVTAVNLSKANKYIQSATINGKALARNYLTHDDIQSGSKVVFVMGSKPNKNWGNSETARPFSMSK